MVGKWIEFRLVAPASPLTQRWEVYTKTPEHGEGAPAFLGRVEWFTPWRKYAFRPVGGHVIFEQDCLRDVAAFLEQQTKAQRGQARQRREAKKARVPVMR